MQHADALHEVTRLTDDECFYIEERYKPFFDYPIHKHAECELNFVENAAGAKRVVGNSEEVIGDLELTLITGAGVEHGWVDYRNKSDRIHEITIHFSQELIFGSFDKRYQFKTIKAMFERAKQGLKFSPQAIEFVRPLLIAIARGNKQDFNTVVLVMNLLHELSMRNDSETLASKNRPDDDSSADNPKTATDRQLSQLRNYLKQHFAEELSIASVAAKMNMSEAEFSRFFQIHNTGVSFKNYLINMRVNHAIRLLIDSTQSIYEIAYNSGFRNLSNFNRIFKKRKGCTPKAFRQRYQRQSKGI